MVLCFKATNTLIIYKDEHLLQSYKKNSNHALRWLYYHAKT